MMVDKKRRKKKRLQRTHREKNEKEEEEVQCGRRARKGIGKKGDIQRMWTFFPSFRVERIRVFVVVFHKIVFSFGSFISRPGKRERINAITIRMLMDLMVQRLPMCCLINFSFGFSAGIFGCINI